LQEFIAGTNPLDPLSGFSVKVKAIPMIQWASISNQAYRVLRKDSIRARNWVALAQVKATDEVTTFVDVTVADPHSFYVIEPINTSQ
jgi:hypothetical protein